jgi:hypothetical protein
LVVAATLMTWTELTVAGKFTNMHLKLKLHINSFLVIACMT